MVIFIYRTKYDAVGNRQTETTTVGTVTTVTTYTYDMSNRLTSTQSVENSVTTQRTDYTYELNGNMLEKKVTPYDNGIAGEQTVKLTNVYDLLNQLTMSTTDDGKTVCNTYNGEGLRIQKSVTQNGTTTTIKYLYDGDKVVAEYDGNNSLKAQNIRGINLLMRIEQNASYYYMYNGHADVTALMNASTGNIDATYYYDAFGTLLSQTGSVSNSYLYAGYQYDAETGLYYLNARMYDSVTARFIQEDTYRGNPNDPLSLNLYTYCANNPLVYHDPTGHWPQWVDNAKKWVKNKYHAEKKKVLSIYKDTKESFNKSDFRKTVTKATKAVKSAVSTGVKATKAFYKKHEQTIKGAAVAVVTVGAVAAGVAATVLTGGLAGAAIGGALIGLGSGVGATGISDYIDDGKFNTSIKDYVANGIGGAVAGAIGGTGVAYAKLGLATTMALGGTSTMAGDATTQFISKGSIDPVQMLEAGTIGALTSGILYGGAKGIGSIKNAITSRNVSNTVSSFEGGSQASLDGVTIINKKFAGETFDLTGDLAKKYPNGVNFTKEGFPDFSPYSTKSVQIQNLQGDAYYDFIKANQAAGYKTAPKGFTWHHVEDGTTMMLVPSDIHGAVRHTGGASLIRQGLRP